MAVGAVEPSLRWPVDPNPAAAQGDAAGLPSVASQGDSADEGCA